MAATAKAMSPTTTDASNASLVALMRRRRRGPGWNSPSRDRSRRRRIPSSAATSEKAAPTMIRRPRPSLPIQSVTTAPIAMVAIIKPRNTSKSPSS